MPNTSPSFIAKGDIRPCRFVKIDTSNDFGVLEADANEDGIGISQEGTKQAPIPGASTLAAADGENIQVYGPGEVCLLQLGSGGATRGGNLKSDADGKGVAVATTGTTIQLVRAVALQSGLEDEKIQVLIRPYDVRPALS